MQPLPSEPAPPLHWVKPPRQARSQKTLERVLDAAEDVIKDRGVGGLTVSEVVRRAGSSVGAFYARFADKEALLSTLHERSCREALATAELALDPDRWAASDLESVVLELVSFTAAQCQERLGLVLAFITLAATDVSFAARRGELEESTAHLMAELLARRSDEIAHRNPRLAASVAVRIVLHTLEYDALIHRPGAGQPSRADGELIAEISRAVLAFLGAPMSVGRRAM